MFQSDIRLVQKSQSLKQQSKPDLLYSQVFFTQRAACVKYKIRREESKLEKKLKLSQV